MIIKYMLIKAPQYMSVHMYKSMYISILHGIVHVTIKCIGIHIYTDSPGTVDDDSKDQFNMVAPRCIRLGRFWQ